MVFVEFLEFICRVTYISEFSYKMPDGTDASKRFDDDDEIVRKFKGPYQFNSVDVNPSKRFIRNLKSMLVTLLRLTKTSTTEIKRKIGVKEA